MLRWRYTFFHRISETAHKARPERNVLSDNTSVCSVKRFIFPGSHVMTPVVSEVVTELLKNRQPCPWKRWQFLIKPYGGVVLMASQCLVYLKYNTR